MNTKTSLKVLETLSYKCTSPKELKKLASKLDSLIADFRTVLPKTEGLIPSTSGSSCCKIEGNKGQTISIYSMDAQGLIGGTEKKINRPKSSVLGRCVNVYMYIQVYNAIMLSESRGSLRVRKIRLIPKNSF